MLSDRKNNITISSIKENGLYFAVGISHTTLKIVRISLPCQDEDEAITIISDQYPNFEVSDEYVEVARAISKIYEGKKVDLNQSTLDLTVDEPNNREKPVKTMFMKNVLLQTYKIPYGEVKTYKYIAEKLGTHAYRAVGTALSKNPFPLIIPCHRVVKSDLSVGQYGGGSEMKKELLKREGIIIEGDKVFRKF